MEELVKTLENAKKKSLVISFFETNFLNRTVRMVFEDSESQKTKFEIQFLDVAYCFESGSRNASIHSVGVGEPTVVLWHFLERNIVPNKEAYFEIYLGFESSKEKLSGKLIKPRLQLLFSSYKIFEEVQNWFL